jgi:PilZ domain
MPFGMEVLRPVSAQRRETRVPMEVGVRISGHETLPGFETTFTENVSAGGARVFSSRRWRPNDRLTIATLTGSFRAAARVAYCQNIPENGFAVGVEFLDTAGNWIVSSMAPSTGPSIVGWTGGSKPAS